MNYLLKMTLLTFVFVMVGIYMGWIVIWKNYS